MLAHSHESASHAAAPCASLERRSGAAGVLALSPDRSTPPTTSTAVPFHEGDSASSDSVRLTAAEPDLLEVPAEVDLGADQLVAGEPEHLGVAEARAVGPLGDVGDEHLVVRDLLEALVLKRLVALVIRPAALEVRGAVDAGVGRRVEDEVVGEQVLEHAAVAGLVCAVRGANEREAVGRDARVREVEVVLEGAAVVRDLPRAVDRRAVGREPAGEPLREVGAVAPQPPLAVAQAHAVRPRDAARVEVVLDEALARLVR